MAIDREKLVRRHNPVLRRFDPESPLSLGNGEFTITVDSTGLQTFPDHYESGIPLCTQSNWGWHSFPSPSGGNDPASLLKLQYYDAGGRSIGYATSSAGQEQLYKWLRQNPHRFNLVSIGFRLIDESGERATMGEVSETAQELDLWTGILESRSCILGIPLLVRTSCHPTLAAVSVRAESTLCSSGRLCIELRFPYGSPETNASDWLAAEKHETVTVDTGEGRFGILRVMDRTRYFCVIHLSGGAQARRIGRHAFVVCVAPGNKELAAVFELSPVKRPDLSLSCKEVEAQSVRHWERFWNNGGCIELAESSDPRAYELERRIVLSQYLTAIQCSGSLPPQETGLTCNSWYGKFHLEMHYWHAAHFPLWQRADMLERSLCWYASIFASAKQKARAQGYEGVRWPKMVGPEGTDSPSPIGPLLIWQQPHFIMLAELVYRVRPDRRTLETYKDLVFATAEFMATYARYDGSRDRYVLGPPLIPAQENHLPESSLNPTFELEYWDFGLRTANAWRKRLGLSENPLWQKIVDKLAPLPTGRGRYLAHERCPDTFSAFNHDHPSLLAAMGMLPGRKADTATMSRTLDSVLKHWNFDLAWGWDFAMTAMTAARIGRARDAVCALLMDSSKNTYLANGHNPQKPKKELPLYLPGNGALLIASAMMAAGWDGSCGKAPGFPKDGSWTVSWESILPLP